MPSTSPPPRTPPASGPSRLLPRASTAVAALAVAWALSNAPRRVGAEDKKPLDFEAVIENAKARVFPALVFVRPVQEDLSGGESRRVEVFGSGVIISPDGYVVTNHHVAEKAREIHCVLNDRRAVDATLVGLDRPTDLALLRLHLAPNDRVPFAELGTSADLTEGQFVMALGAPYGFERSISLGIVSNASRQLGENEEHLFNTWIQTDAAINPGNSGGPLVDTRGRVVGINTLGIQMANSLGFSIPVDVVRRVVERLKADGKVRRSHTGITLRPLVDYLQNTVFPGEHGVIVDDVVAGSPAEAAGVHKGDRLLDVAGRATDGKHREDLPEIRWTLADLPDGKPSRLRLERDGKELVLELTPDLSDAWDDEGLETPRWNATFQTIRRERVPDLAFHRAKGVYALGIKYAGNAQKAGLVEGDIVLSIDRKPVEGLDALKAAYDAATTDKRLKKVALLEILREGRREFLALDFTHESDGEDK